MPKEGALAQVIILNGGSSSGKSSVATSLQDILATPWLRLGVDEFIETLPPRLLTDDSGITFGDDGSVRPGPEFRRLEAAWMRGVAAMAHAGAHIIIEEVFVGGVESRNRWQVALTGLDVFWVGVHCDPAVAAERERARGDRVSGMAETQALAVHIGAAYDLEVDTSAISPRACAQLIAQAAGLIDA